MEDFSRRFGAYPYPSHTLALTPGLSGGIEYPGHVMQGPGTLGRTTSHEVGHLWFYSLVGNNQGRDPWIDEGLASWAEARFENSLRELSARDMPGPARGRAGEPMTYWETHRDSYYRGTYVQPVQALAALGDPERVDCALRLFVAANAFGVARPGDVLAALTQVFPDAEATLAGAGIVP
jgi:aminopeptidase N